MRTVACVLREGRGNYTEEWVYKLLHGVEKNLSGRFDFVCLSDRFIPNIDVIPLKRDWPHWWSKIELFEPGLFIEPVLYFDLDVLILGQIDHLFASRGFYMARDFFKPSLFNSSVMSWNCDMGDVYVELEAAPEGTMRHYDVGRGGKVGDQAFTQEHTSKKIRPFTDGDVLSYKRDCRHLAQAPSAPVVAFHGKPKPNDVPGWPSEIWRDL